MKTHRIRAAAHVLPFLLFAGVAQAQGAPPAAQPPAPPAQAAPAQVEQPAQVDQPAQAQTFTKERLDQMLAQIALYPDQLVTNILMASTYPSQVAEAAVWLKDANNAALKDDALVNSLRPLPWDPSVKFLVPFPQLVQQLNDSPNWTRDLGVAFSYQQADVMAEVQHLRQLAFACGKLQTTPQMTVTRQDSVIAIAPTNPRVVYVPVYNPVVVYGAWPYPAYPPLYYRWPSAYLMGGVGFGFDVGIGYSVGFGVVDRYWGWSRPDWRGGMVNVNIDRVTNITNYNRSYASARYAGGNWRHSADQGIHGRAGLRAGSAGISGRHGASHTGHGVRSAHSHVGGHSTHGHGGGHTAVHSHGGGHSVRSHGGGGGAHGGGSHGGGGGHAGGGHSGGGSHGGGHGGGQKGDHH